MLTGWWAAAPPTPPPGHSSKSSVDEGSVRSHRSDSGSFAEDDTQLVDGEQGNVLSHLISQLRPGADLSRVVLPTFILEPRSMLERITNFMCHPEMLLPIPEIDDPVERFLGVVKFYLSGWHIRPPGVKKPLNPILGEIFTCYWDLPDESRAYYISEQTSHHPPKSSYFYMVPDHHIRVDGTLKPRSKFLGNSAASMMEGIAILSLLNRGEDKSRGERYILTQPNMYARGLLFGKMKYELGDHSYVRCPELDLVADIDFKVKGWVSGTYNAIGGNIHYESTGEILYELSGLWSEEMFITNVITGQRDMFFDGQTAKPSPPLVRPIEDQEERESQRLWTEVAHAVRERNHEMATDEKTKIEDRQREEAALRAQDGVEWHPRLFRRVKGGPGASEEGEEDLEWIINAHIDASDPKKQAQQIMGIFPVIEGQKPDPRNAIPPRASLSSLPSPRETKDDEASGDLIDFGPYDEAQKPSSWATSKRDTGGLMDAPNQGSQGSQGAVQDLLGMTGAPAPGGSLLDFQYDMAKSLPSKNGGGT